MSKIVELNTAVTNVRKDISLIIHRLETNKQSPEYTTAWRHAQMAKGWIGKVEVILAVEETYKVSDTVEGIPPTKGVYPNTIGYPITSTLKNSKTTLQICNEDREMLSIAVDNVNEILAEKEISSIIQDLTGPVVADLVRYFQNCLTALESSSMVLGFVLANILEEKSNSRKMDNFKQYRRSNVSELRPYVQGEDIKDVSISSEDLNAGSPKVGDMIARNPKNHKDQWLVAQKYFEDNFEEIE